MADDGAPTRARSADGRYIRADGQPPPEGAVEPGPTANAAQQAFDQAGAPPPQPSQPPPEANTPGAPAAPGALRPGGSAPAGTQGSPRALSSPAPRISRINREDGSIIIYGAGTPTSADTRVAVGVWTNGGSEATVVGQWESGARVGTPAAFSASMRVAGCPPGTDRLMLSPTICI